MTILKRLILSLPVLLLSCGDALASHSVFLGSGVRRSLSMNSQRVCSVLHARHLSLASFGFVLPGKSNQRDMPEAKDPRDGVLPNSLATENIWDKLERCEEALTEAQRVFREIKHLAEALKHESDRDPVESTPLLPLQIGEGAPKMALIAPSKKLERKLAVITPVYNGEIGARPTPCQETLLSMEQEQDGKVEELQPNPQEVFEIQEEAQDLPAFPTKMRKELISKTMKAFNNKAHKANEQDVIALIDLYSKFAFCSQQSISRVLNGETNTPKSVVYNSLLKYVSERGSTLSEYRDIYARLCRGVGENGLQAILDKAAEEILIKNEQMFGLSALQSRGAISREAYVSMVVTGAHPFYPVHPNEAEAILDLYADLKIWSKSGIGKVLSGRTNTPKSSIYQAILKHAAAKRSTIRAYRDMYARASKSLNGGAIHIIFKVHNPMGAHN